MISRTRGEVLRSLVAALLCLFAWIASRPAFAAPQYTIVDLGLGSQGATSSSATAINNAGQVGGTYYFAGGGAGSVGAVIWTNGTATPQYYGNVGSQIFGMNAQGIACGQGLVLGGGPDFAASFTNGIGSLVDPSLVTGFSSAYGINDTGEIAGSFAYTSQIQHAFVFRNGHLVALSAPAGEQVGNSAAIAVNNAGLVAGWVQIVQAGVEPWDLFAVAPGSSQMTDVGTLPGTDRAIPMGINAAGQIVGFASIGGIEEAFLYQNGALTGLPAQGLMSRGNAINIHGAIVGRLMQSDFLTTSAAIYINGIWSDLNQAIDPSLGWRLTEATGINDAGQICGTGSKGGVAHAVLLIPNAIPSTITSFTVTPAEVPAPGPTVSADVLAVGTFSKVTLSGNPQDVSGPVPVIHLVQHGSHWTATFPTSFLMFAKVNPITLVATATRPDGTTAQATATLGVHRDLPRLLLSLTSDKTAVHHFETLTCSGNLVNHSGSASPAVVLTIALPSHMTVLSASGIVFNSATNTLSWSGPLSGVFGSLQTDEPFSFTVQVDGSAPKGCVLTISGNASGTGFQPANQTVAVVVNSGLVPSSVTVDATKGYGLLFGDAAVNLELGTPPLHASLTPRVEVTTGILGTRPFSLWLGVSESHTPGAHVSYGSDAAGMLAKRRLIAPSVSPRYEVSFDHIDDSVSLSVSCTQDACVMNFLELLLQQISAAINVPLPSADRMVALADDPTLLFGIKQAAGRFSPPPRSFFAGLIAFAKASGDLVNMPAPERESLRLACEAIFKKKIDVAVFTTLLDNAFTVRDLLINLSDMLNLDIATGGHDMVVRFVAAPGTSGP